MTASTADGGRGGVGWSDDRGQSEVIGTILMVSIALIVAAGAAQFVFGIDIVRLGPPEAGPQVSFGTDEVGDDLVVEHQSGDALEMETLTFTVDGEDASGDVEADIGADDTWTSGEEVTVEDVEPGQTVRIVWNAPDSDESTYLLVHEYDG